MLITGVIVMNSYLTYKQFYLIAMKLSSNKIYRLVFINDVLLSLVIFAQILIKIFFRQLEDLEQEKVWEHSRDTFLETCLAMTIFKSDLTFYAFSLFVFSIFFKVFHWSCKYRVSHMETQIEITTIEYFRMFTLMSLLFICDLFFIGSFTYHFFKFGPSMRLFFLTEFVIMMTIAVSSFARLVIHNIHLQSEGNWESRDPFLFYLDITTDLSQSLVYITFFFVIFYHYGLPIHLIRDIFMTIQSSIKRISDFMNYRRLLNTMKYLLPDATPEELDGKDCVICWNRMETACKKLPCGHCFHESPCLRNLLEESTLCPLCRQPIDIEEYEESQRQQRSNQDNMNQQHQLLQQQQQQQHQNPNAVPPPLMTPSSTQQQPTYQTADNIITGSSRPKVFEQNPLQQYQQEIDAIFRDLLIEAHQNELQGQQQQQQQQQLKEIFDNYPEVKPLNTYYNQSGISKSNLEGIKSSNEVSNNLTKLEDTRIQSSISSTAVQTTLTNTEKTAIGNISVSDSGSNLVDEVVAEMHIKYLENCKAIIDETITKLNQFKNAKKGHK